MRNWDKTFGILQSYCNFLPCRKRLFQKESYTCAYRVAVLDRARVEIGSAVVSF